MHLLGVFLDNLLPVFLAAGCGAWLVRRNGIDPRAVSSVAFNVFSPALMFDLVVTHGASRQDALWQSLAALVALGGVAALVWGFCRWRGVPRTKTAAAVLLVTLPNAGNFGLSVHRFAFGEEALVHAALYFVAASVWSYSAGVFIASLGKVGPREAAGALVRVPALWAVAAASFVQAFSLPIPVPVERTVSLLSDACIPTFLVLLGMQLVRHGRWEGSWRPIGLALVGRLLVAPALAYLLVEIAGYEGLSRKAAILQSGMPTAVVTTILATQYDLEPGLITRGVVVSTLVSPLTLTPILAALGA